METENLFAMSRKYFETAFSNLETFQHQNEKLLELSIQRPDHEENMKLKNNYNEWALDARKALSDYRELLLKGLDYLAANLEAGRGRPSA
jgi:hypothetical protein